MKKILFNLSVICIILGFASCENPVTQVADEVQLLSEEIQLNRSEALANIDPVSVDSIINDNPEIDVRGGEVEYRRVTRSMSQGQWYGLQYSKSTLSNYKIIVEIVSNSGEAKAYAFGYGNGDYRYIRRGTNKTYVSSADLSYNEDAGYIGVYCTSPGQATIKFSYERIDQNGGNNGGGSNSSGFTAYPKQASPNNGIVNQTNFYFKVNISNGSAHQASITFKAPDGQYYSGISMNKSGSKFYLTRKLSQVGTYYYKYIVQSSGQEYTSQWYSLTVLHDASGSFSSSCITNRWSNCNYARSQNAFYVSDASLAGQCTWYSYGRVVELADNGEIPSHVKQKMINAFWGKSGRHAKNWPAMLGGNWYNTNSSVLPSHKRKKGMLAVWIFGSYGHVGFVEEISADGKSYRLSDFNRSSNTNKKDVWYTFEGVEDRLGGVYPRFLDLASL